MVFWRYRYSFECLKSRSLNTGHASGIRNGFLKWTTVSYMPRSVFIAYLSMRSPEPSSVQIPWSSCSTFDQPRGQQHYRLFRCSGRTLRTNHSLQRHSSCHHKRSRDCSDAGVPDHCCSHHTPARSWADCSGYPHIRRTFPSAETPRRHQSRGGGIVDDPASQSRTFVDHFRPPSCKRRASRCGEYRKRQLEPLLELSN